MTEPEIPPIILSDEYISELEKNLPLMPGVLRDKLSKVGVTISQVETIIEEPKVAHFVAAIADKNATAARTIANWLTGDLLKLVMTHKLTWQQIIAAESSLTKLAAMVAENKLSSTNAKELLIESVTKTTDPEQLATERHLIQVSDTGAIEKMVVEVLAENTKAAEDVKNGEMKVIGFLVGQVMAKSKGQANPGLAQQIIKKQLDL